MSDNAERSVNQQTNEAAVAARSRLTDEAALLMKSTGKTSKEAAATVENSDFINSGFKGASQEEQNAAYRYLMHKQGIPGYANVPPGDAKLLSPQDTAKLDNFLKSHQQPTLDLNQIQAESASLGKVMKGEGYYQVITRDHPYLDEATANKMAHAVKRTMGNKDVLRQGEQIEVMPSPAPNHKS
jgi:hypothetical protein